MNYLCFTLFDEWNILIAFLPYFVLQDQDFNYRVSKCFHYTMKFQILTFFNNICSIFRKKDLATLNLPTKTKEFGITLSVTEPDDLSLRLFVSFGLESMHYKPFFHFLKDVSFLGWQLFSKSQRYPYFRIDSHYAPLSLHNLVML